MSESWWRSSLLFIKKHLSILYEHPLRAPLDIHPRHSPSASTLFMMVLVLYFMIFATVVVVLLLLLLLVVLVVLLLFLTPG